MSRAYFLKFNWPLDASNKNIIAINYPAGGFGHFIYYLLTHYTQETVKVPDEFEFSSTGDAHHQVRYISSYFHDWEPDFVFNLTCNLEQIPDNQIPIVICDNGAVADVSQIQRCLPNSRILRISVDTDVRVTLLRLCADKALSSNLRDWASHQTTMFKAKNPIEISPWTDAKTIWTMAECVYSKWHPISSPNIINFSLKQFLLDPLAAFETLCTQLNLTIIDRDKLNSKIEQWGTMHNKYQHFASYWDRIETALDCNENLDLSFVVEWWDHVDLFYCVCKKYHLKILEHTWLPDKLPEDMRNTILNGFKNTREILEFIELYDQL